jgi:transcription elongation factor GreA
VPPTTEDLADLFDLARRKEWVLLEAQWLEALGDPITDPAFFTQLAQRLVKYHEESRLDEMAQLMAMELNDEGRHQEALRVLRSVLRVAPDLPGVHTPLLRALRGAHGDLPATERCIKTSGLTAPDSLGKSLGLFEQMMMTAEGSVFRHKSWGIGVVVEQDLEGQQATIDFPERRGQTFNFAGIREFLERIPNNHILAQAARDPDQVRAQAKEDPVGLVKHALNCNGEAMRQTDLKAIFVPAVFTPAQWSRWWSTAKDKLRLDPYLEVGAGVHGGIALRDEPRSVAEDLQDQFRAAETHEARQQAVRETIRFLRSGSLDAAAASPLSGILQAGHEAAESPADALSWAYLAEELAEAAGSDAAVWRPDTGALLSERGPSVEIIEALALSDHQMRALEQCRARIPALFTELCVALIEDVPLTMAKWIMRELLSDEAFHRAAEEALAQLLRDPRGHPEAFLWAMRQVLGGPWAHLSVANDAPHLLDRTLVFLEELQRRIDREDPDLHALRGLATRIRNALEESRHELVVHTLRDLGTEQARVLYERMMGMTALSDAWKEAAANSLRNVRSDLDDRERGGESSEIHFVTEAKLRGKQVELQRLRTEEIPQNSKEIQVAREHGDLSENAEYKAAKERQELLHRRAEELQDLIDRARPLSPETINTEVVSPGTRIVVRKIDSGEEETYTLLGLWDAEPDKGVISYLSPFGQQILRRRVGDRLTLELPSGERPEYEVLRIENALRG